MTQHEFDDFWRMWEHCNMQKSKVFIAKKSLETKRRTFVREGKDCLRCVNCIDKRRRKKACVTRKVIDDARQQDESTVSVLVETHDIKN